MEITSEKVIERKLVELVKLNVAADLFVEMLEDNPELKDKVINSFKA